MEYSPVARQKLLKIKCETEEKYGETIAKRILENMLKSIRQLMLFENKGISLNATIGIQCDYRYLYVEHNYVFYRVDDRSIKIVDILNEREDFMRILFGIETISEATLNYWQE